MNGWITNELPDSELTVLMRVTDDEYPVWPGFHDGEGWRYADATYVLPPQKVTGWVHLEDAAKAIDQVSNPHPQAGR